MKFYEFLLILNPQFSDDELPGVLDGVFDVIRKEGGEVKQHKVVGRQALAYPINHMKHGCYILAEIEVESEALTKINRAFRLMPEILRFDISKDVSESEFNLEKVSEKVEPKEFVKKESMVETAPKEHNEQKSTETTIKEQPTPETPKEKLEESLSETPAPDKSSAFVKASVDTSADKPEDKKDKIPLEDLDKKLEEILKEEVL